MDSSSLLPSCAVVGLWVVFYQLMRKTLQVRNPVTWVDLVLPRSFSVSTANRGGSGGLGPDKTQHEPYRTLRQLADLTGKK